jgi:DNA-binding PadR family transcriptional regulator
MALRDPEIPNHRERSTLQLMKYDRWIVGNDLYPAGKGTIASLVKKGWIEQRTGPSGAHQFRITPAGRTALHARIR